MYTTRTGLVLGFHGCDEAVVNRTLNGNTSLKDSKNKYDWLGHGIYFWDNSPARALEFADFLVKNPGKAKNPIKKPSVIGAVINLGYCLDLLDYQNLSLLRDSYDLLVASYSSLGEKLPVNKPITGNNDLLLRELDCAVIEILHQFRSDNGMRPFDSVRGVFWEGNELYRNAGFREKDHIQICVRNPNCIKGYFLPQKEHPKHNKV